MRNHFNMAVAIMVWLGLIVSSIAVAYHLPALILTALAAFGVYTLGSDALLAILKSLNGRGAGH